jgi:LuxR family transcriptional regulator, maltose regulon positive regulatory protein
MSEQTRQYPEYKALKNIVRIDFVLKRGEFDTASDLLARSDSDIEKFGLIFFYSGFVEARAMHFISTKAFPGFINCGSSLRFFHSGGQ